MAPFMSFDSKGNQSSEKEPEKAAAVKASTTVQENAEITLDHRMEKIANSNGMAISVPKYTTSQLGKVKVSWAIINETDYYYQIEFLGNQEIDEREAIGEIITKFSAVVPDHIHVYIYQPPAGIDIPLYTVIVKNSAKLHGAKEFMEKRLVEKILEMGTLGGA